MDQNQAWQLLAIFGVAAFLIVRSGEVRAWVAIIIGLAGYLLALTPLGYPVIWAISFIT